jgi:hypothetical protein
MQCANCGRPLRPHEARCPFCGAPAGHGLGGAPDDAPTLPDVQTPRQVVAPGGPPVDPFAPTIYGPPVGPERYARVYAPSAASNMRRIEGYRVVAPPPVVERRSTRLRGLAAVVAIAALLLLAGGALAATGHGLHGLSPLLGQSRVPTVTPTIVPSPTPACPAPAVNSQAAQALDQVVLATGVAGAALKPVDQISSFSVGQTIHVVFHIRAPSGGTVDARFCTSGAVSVTNKPLAVPAGYATRLGQNARGQFYLNLESSNVGHGMVTLTWNGQVAAVVPFTVVATSTHQP